MTSAEWPERIGRYRILSELGRGSMGRVYLALDPNLDRQIALKVIAPVQLADPDERADLERRFLNEARAAARLHHPGIVMVLDADTDPATGSSYLAMELVEGRSLKTLLRESDRLPVATAVDLGSQVARALDHAHRAGVVHRDVKPANILVTPEGRIKVTDFGIAKVASQSMTLTGHILGSPFYMSPEHVEGGPMDGRADLFSLGSILYQSVTGELPFGGDTLAAVTYKVVQVDPRPLRSHDGDLPASLETTIERALEKDPERRFQTGAEMATALDSVGGELGLPARTGPETGASGETGEASASEIPSIAVPEAPSDREREREGSGTGTLVVDSRALASSATAHESTAHESTVQKETAGQEPAEKEAPAGTERSAVPVGGTTRPRTKVPRRTLVLAGLGAACLVLLGFFVFGSREAPAPPPGPVLTVGDLGRDEAADAGGTLEPSDAIEVPETLQPPPVPSAKLGVVYVQRLTLARLSLWVDGELVWSRQVDRPGGFFKRLAGRRIEDAVPVTPGPHTIEVRVTGPRNLEVRDVLEGSFRDGEVRWLRVGLNPVTKNLKLSWIE